MRFVFAIIAFVTVVLIADYIGAFFRRRKDPRLRHRRRSAELRAWAVMNPTTERLARAAIVLVLTAMLFGMWLWSR